MFDFFTFCQSKRVKTKSESNDKKLNRKLKKLSLKIMKLP